MFGIILLIILMIFGAVAAINSKDLISAIVLMGIVGFGLVLCFLLLEAPDLAIVQVVVETLTLIILLSVILKTTNKEIEGKSMYWIFGFLFSGLFLILIIPVILNLPQFGNPIMRMSGNYLSLGLKKTGAGNLVTSVILDFRGYDTLGEATVLFTSVIGILAVLRRKGRRK
jgi:multisubunit Na+/H+ antiporter MnhB subunit